MGSNEEAGGGAVVGLGVTTGTDTLSGTGDAGATQSPTRIHKSRRDCDSESIVGAVVGAGVFTAPGVFVVSSVTSQSPSRVHSKLLGF